MSHVDITVKLARAGSKLTLMIGALIFILGFWVGCNIYFAFSSGRVAQILQQNKEQQQQPVTAVEQ